MNLDDYVDPKQCPAERPELGDMGAQTRELHEAIDARIRQTGQPFLHPDGQTVQIDLLGGDTMVQWQEAKGSCTMLRERCWSELPQVYARYGTEPGRRLISSVRALESAKAAVLTDTGMQATALLIDVLLKPRGHAVISQQVYNKTKTYVRWLAERLNANVDVVERVEPNVLDSTVRPDTTIVFAETFTNPLMRALDPVATSDAIVTMREERAPSLRMVVDNTIVSPWGVKEPLLSHPGIHVVVNAGTKAMSGEDREMWGYVASGDVELMNQVMDLQAMRGGVLSWRSAEMLAGNLTRAEGHFRQRCKSAKKIVEFLEEHPRVSEVFHPSAKDHLDAEIVEKHYSLCGSLISFRGADLNEEQATHVADVMATCIPIRYALSFDGLTTKINHHKSVSEFYTPDALVKKQGIDRLIRLGVGVEDCSDIIACLNWALWNHDKVHPTDLEAWRAARRSDLGISGGG